MLFLHYGRLGNPKVNFFCHVTPWNSHFSSLLYFMNNILNCHRERYQLGSPIVLAMLPLTGYVMFIFFFYMLVHVCNISQKILTLENVSTGSYNITLTWLGLFSLLKWRAKEERAAPLNILTTSTVPDT